MKKRNDWQIAAAVIGGSVALAGIICALTMLYRRWKRKPECYYCRDWETF